MKAILTLEDNSDGLSFTVHTSLQLNEMEMLELSKTGIFPKSKAKKVADALIAAVKDSYPNSAQKGKKLCH
jgi:hypothetical protein